MKRFLSLILVTTMFLSLITCGYGEQFNNVGVTKNAIAYQVNNAPVKVNVVDKKNIPEDIMLDDFFQECN